MDSLNFKALGMTQIELARLMGVNRVTVHRWAKGTAPKLALAFQEAFNMLTPEQREALKAALKSQRENQPDFS